MQIPIRLGLFVTTVSAWVVGYLWSSASAKDYIQVLAALLVLVGTSESTARLLGNRGPRARIAVRLSTAFGACAGVPFGFWLETRYIDSEMFEMFCVIFFYILVHEAIVALALSVSNGLSPR